MRWNYYFQNIALLHARLFTAPSVLNHGSRPGMKIMDVSRINAYLTRKNISNSQLHENIESKSSWFTSIPAEDFIVDEFFSTVPGNNFDLCIISTRT